jgi:hypothetical protein
MEREAVIKDWLQFNCPNMPATWAVHDNPEADPRNPHCHLLISERQQDGIERSPEQFFKRFNAANPDKGGCKKADLGSNRREWLANARESWATILNKHLPPDAQVSHLSLANQGIQRNPQPKIGAKVLGAERRGHRTRLMSVVIEDELHKCRIRCLSFVDPITGKTVTYQAGRDRGDSVEIIGKVSRSKVIDLVNACKEKGWQEVEIYGTPEFQAMARAELRKAGIRIKGEQQDEQNSQHHRNEDGRSSQPDSEQGRNASPVRIARPGNQHGRDSRPSRGSVGRNGEAGADNRNTSTTSKATDQADLRTTDISVAGRGRTAVRDPAGQRNDIHALAGSTGVRANQQAGGYAMSKDLTSIMVQKQLKSMAGVDTFEVGVRDGRNGKMQNIEMTRADVLASVPRLKRENAKGQDIYIRPSPKSSHPYVLLDDVGAGTINKMRADGIDTVLEIETSPINFQILIRLPENLARADRKAVERILVERYKADHGSADGGHYFRLAGFTNRKPGHRQDDGRFPFVKVTETKPDGVLTDDVWQPIKRESEQRQADELLAKPLPLPLARASVPGGVMRDDQVWQLGRDQFERAIAKFGSSLDLSRTDYFISRNLLQMGATEDQLRRMLVDVSPDLATRKAGHVEDYVSRTVSRAYSSMPELAERDRQAEAAVLTAIESQERHDQAERQRRDVEKTRDHARPSPRMR